LLKHQTVGLPSVPYRGKIAQEADKEDEKTNSVLVGVFIFYSVGAYLPSTLIIVTLRFHSLANLTVRRLLGDSARRSHRELTIFVLLAASYPFRIRRDVLRTIYLSLRSPRYCRLPSILSTAVLSLLAPI
jgi:hypothetical protein